MLDEFYDKLGKRIRQLREDRGWTQDELIAQIEEMKEESNSDGLATGFAETSVISNIENCRRIRSRNPYLISSRQLESLAKVFKAKKSYLIFGDDEDKIDLIDSCFKQLEPREGRKKELLQEIAGKNSIDLKEIYNASKGNILKKCDEHVFRYKTMSKIDDTFVDKVGKEIIFYIEGELMRTIINSITRKTDETINRGDVKKEKIISYTMLLSQFLSELCDLIENEISKKTSREKANIVMRKMIQKMDELKENII